jgi:hypothetical protein
VNTVRFLATARRTAGLLRAAWAGQASAGRLLNLLAVVIFLPMVVQAEPQPAPQSARVSFYGLAAASQPASDIELLGADWFHAWQVKNPYPTSRAQFVPMLWDGLPSDSLSSSYAGVILVGNEPDNPNQLNISPEEMARRLAVTRKRYPKARLLCCGTLSYHPDYVRAFIAAGGRPDGWQLHAYIEGPFSADDIIAQLTTLHQVTGGPAWITEFSALDGDVEQFAKLTTWMEQQPWIERIAPYTNRQPNTGQWWEIDQRVNLVSPQGTLTALGAYYASRSKAGP